MPDQAPLGRAYAAPEKWTEASELTLGTDESRHIAKVLRAQPGQRVDIFDGCGRQARSEVVSCMPGAVVLRLVERVDIPPERPQLTLIQALPKGQKMDFVIQKAVEIGAHRIQPASTLRVEVHPREIKINRWQRIAQEASRQCEAAWKSEVFEPVPLLDALRQAPGSVLMAHVDSNAQPLREVLGSMREHLPETLAICVGPEGGFAPEELAAATKLGVQPVSLGSRILRTETAGLFALSVIRHALFA